MGMNREAVQPSRDAIGKHQFNKKRRRQVVQLESDAYRQDTLATEAQNQSGCSYQIASLTAQSPPLASLPYLNGMRIAYQNLLERRRTLHSLQNISSLFEDNQTDFPASNIDMHIECQRKEFGLVSEMMNGFGQFRELPIDQKCIMFKRFFTQFMATERAYDTLKMFGIDTTRFLMANRAYIDINNLNQFFENGTLVKKDPQGMARIFGSMVNEIHVNLLKPMDDMKITEIELLALLGQLLWSTGNSDLTAETNALAKNVRETIFLELQTYYANIQEENCLVRFGNLMLLVPAANTLNSVMRENFRMIKLFGLMETDNLFEELLSL